MRTWLVWYSIILMLIPVYMLSLPDWATTRIENYLDKYLRRRNERKGFTDPELYMDVPELVSHRGYPIESHEVVTDDGYYVTIHRVRGKNNLSSSPKPVVFFQHGLWQSSMAWLLTPVNKSLAFILADRGYDVWLGNLRGCRYSRKHIKYTTKDDEYWDFAWDQFGQYDTPAMLKYVLNHTQQKDLTYIGHSLGCAVFFIFADIHPELQSLVNGMIALGPASIVSNMKSPMRYLAPFVNQLEFMFRLMGTNEFLANSNLLRVAFESFCTKTSEQPRKCENIIFMVYGSDPRNFNASLMPLINRYSPDGTSVRTVTQYAQGVNFKRFCRYDWGRAQNLKRYGQDTPPDYSLENIKVPVEVFYSDNDWLTVPEDVAATASRLGNLKGFHRVPFEDYTHIDYLFAVNNDVLLNTDVINLVAKYNPLPAS